MNTSTVLRRRALEKFPGATCKREGNLYVVRDAEGALLTARESRSGAWSAAGRK